MTTPVSPTAGQHDANAKRYNFWADVMHVLAVSSPVLIVLLGDDSDVRCHMLVNLFGITYTRELIIASTAPTICVSHHRLLGHVTKQFETNVPASTFGLMVPIMDDDGNLK